ncbi:MAG: DUF1573 domain-containing protein [Planctomycetota bacterium]
MHRVVVSILVILSGIGIGCDKSQEAAKAPAPTVAPPAPNPVADPTKPKVPGPRWVAEQVVFEFGEVWGGEVITYPFRISNEGSELLKILDAKPRCSCSVAEGYAKEIAPGASGFIPFKLNTSGKKGAVDESLAIKTNDPVRPEMTLRLRGVVKQLVEVEVITDSTAASETDPKGALEKIRGSQFSFGIIKSSQQLQRTARVKNTSGRPVILKLHPITPADSRFSATFQEVSPGEEFLLTVTGDPPFPGGVISASVPLETNIPGRPFYNIGIHAYVPGRIDVMPPKIVVDPNYPYTRERTITITNYGQGPFALTGLLASHPNYKLELLPKQPTFPNQTQVKLTLPEQPYAPPPYGDLIRFETTDTEMKTLDVQVLPNLERAATPRPAEAPIKFHPSPLTPQG